MSIRLSKMTAGTVADADLMLISQLSTTVVYTATSISAVASDNSLHDEAAQWIAEGFDAGMAVRIQGFTGDTGNNYFSANVTSVDASKLTLDADFPLVDDAAGESVTVTKWVSRRTTAADVAALAASSDASGVTYTPSSSVNWPGDTDPGNVDDALNVLADAVNDLQGIAGSDADNVTYTPSSAVNWPGNADPGNVADALDSLAQSVDNIQGTGLVVTACGFRGIPQVSQTGNYTTVATDAGKHIVHPAGAGAGDTFTIASNATIAYEIGTAITFVNLATDSVSIAIASDTMYLAGAGTTGTRSLAQYGVATAVKVTSTSWLISGTGLT